MIENAATGEAASPSIVSRFLARDITGPAAFAAIGGRLDAATVGAAFYPFARGYLHRGEHGYFADMAEWFPVPSIFDIRDTWHNYEWMRIRLVERYAEWRAST